MRTLAIDLGTRRVGLALSDEGGRFATPYDVLTVNSADQALPPIIKLIQNESIQRIVLGLPLNMDNTLGPAAKSVMQWANELKKQTNVPVVFVDERLSSFTAEQHLNDAQRAGARMTRKDKKQKQDAIAAASFLQEFLDGKISEIDLSDLH